MPGLANTWLGERAIATLALSCGGVIEIAIATTTFPVATATAFDQLGGV
ncbi:MAG TPA: hypothetical protein VIJ40_01895 [Acidimicrobiales bacterium]